MLEKADGGKDHPPPRLPVPTSNQALKFVEADFAVRDGEKTLQDRANELGETQEKWERLLGLRPPVTSWGVLLTEAQNINVVALYPWLMLPVVPVFVIVLAFNFFGDGLRDAADPYR